MSYPGNHRSTRSVLSLKGFRGRLVALIVIAGFVCITFNAALFYAYVVDSYDLILRHSTLPEEIIDNRYAELFGIALALGVISVVIVLIVAVWALYLMHRVSGPVYHLHKVIEAIRSGRADERLHLRAKDEFQDVAQSFNRLMDEMQAKTGPRA